MGLLLAGCGGGGSDGGDEGPPPPAPAGFSISGTVLPAAGTLIDGDINNPRADYRPNDTLDTAQQLLNPVVLGGYVNDPGSGPAGRSRGSGDPVDWYRVFLTAGQGITLAIAGNGRASDLDLFLTDADGNLLDASVGRGATEQLRVDRDGEYFIAVQTFREQDPQQPLGIASAYLLSIGDVPPSMAPTALRLSQTMVPGQIVASLRDKASAAALSRDGWRQGTGGAGSLVLLERIDKAASLPWTPLGGRPVADPAQRARLDTLLAVKRLSRTPGVAFAEPNALYQAQFVPDDEQYPLQWHYPLIHLPQAWDLSTGRRADGTRVRVAVLDTGIVPDHPDLTGQIVDGYDFISDPVMARDGDGPDPDPSDPGDGDNPDGSSTFHGTHIAGTVAAVTDNALGVAGVAFGARVMPLRVLGAGGGTVFDIAQGIYYAAGLSNSTGALPDRPADIINLSLGGPVFSQTLEDAINAARDAGVVVVASAGNSNGGFFGFPAVNNNVIAVGAVDTAGKRSYYSNFGFYLDVAAPGGDRTRDLDGDGNLDGVLSTHASDETGAISADYGYLSGTSMAAPHVSGVVALMLAANPNLTPEDIDHLLASGLITRDQGDAGRDDEYGYGLIDAFAAVSQAILARGGTVPDPLPVLSAAPPALNFGLDRDAMELTLSGIGPVGQTRFTVDGGPWLTVTPLAVDGVGLGRYRLAVDRTDLPDGVYETLLTFTATQASVRVPVMMQVDRDITGSAVGPQQVWLVDADSGAVVRRVTAQAGADGEQAFVFTDIPAGRYRLFAGSDLNNDGMACGPGEACGAWLTLDQPAVLELTADVSGVTFSSAFDSTPNAEVVP